MPPKRSRVVRTPPADHLPAALTPLLGRTRELDETTRLLGNTRLLTITGAGGSGKTRLALELARRAAGKFDDAVWVDLAPLSHPDLIPQQLMAALRLREIPNRDELDVVIESLRERAVLLVFDNCEHLVDACAAAAETILRSCPRATILATTREALGVGGEQTWLVPPMIEAEAVQLFIERARSASPSFDPADHDAAIAHICTRLDGIPLAIELAAARVKVMSVDQIAERLDDAFRLLTAGSRTLPRHRTIRETIDWSYRLLGEDEQVLLRRLAVFGGTFSLAAAESICGCDHRDVLELLLALVDKSLVQRSGSRYRLLETVRQFAAEKFEASGEKEALRERHARYFLAEAEDAEPRLFAGASDAALIHAIDEDLGNLRAALDWCEEDASRAEVELRMLYAIRWYWFARGHFHEARRRADAALARAANVDPLLRARAALTAGNAAVWQADWKPLRSLMADAVDTFRNAHDDRSLSAALMILGTGVAFGDGDPVAARRLLEDAEAAARRHGRDINLALTLYWSGLVDTLLADLSRARTMFAEAHAIGVEQNHAPGMAHPQTLLGHVSLRERNYDEAIGHFHRALELHHAIDDRWGLTQVVEGIGLLMLDIDDAEEGTRLLAAAEAAWLQLGARPGRSEDVEREKQERIRQALGDDRLRVVLASGAALPYEAMVALARKHAERLAGAAGAAPQVAPALRVRALGTLEIEPLDASASLRSRELLLFLLCNPKGVTKEQIGAALWPDIDPEKLRNNFHVTLHRLRKALGNADLIVATDDVYRIDPNARVEFDAETFEREARAGLRDAGRLAKAVELYRGEFFTNAGGEWHHEVRDRLRDLYARSLAALARARTAENDHRAAADAYERLLALDPLDEEVARNLMLAYAKLDDAPSATRAYKRLTEALRKELNTPPAPATTRVYAEITGR